MFSTWKPTLAMKAILYVSRQINFNLKGGISSLYLLIKQISIMGNKEYQVQKKFENTTQKKYEKTIQTKSIARITKPNLQEIQSTLLLKAQPMFLESNEANEQELGSKQRRQLCETPEQYPFSAIGVLYFFQYLKFGTGFLIQSNILLTAAHNIYDRKSKEATNQAKLVMEIHGDKKEFQAVCAYFPRQYKQKQMDKDAMEFDYAIVILRTIDIIPAQKYSTIPLSCEMKLDDQIQVYGYPFSLSKDQFYEDKFNFHTGKSEKTPKQKSLFGCKGHLKELGQRFMLHLAPTSPGQSGSPVLRFNKQYNRYEAIGVHTQGWRKQNGAVRINKEVLDRISRWKQDFSNQRYNQMVMLIDEKAFQIIKRDGIEYKINNKTKVKLTPDKQSRGFKEGHWLIDNTNSNVCIRNVPYGSPCNWLCSSALPFDGEFVFTIKAIKLTGNIYIGVMEEGKKGEKWRDTMNYSVYLYLNPFSQRIRRPNEEQTEQQSIKCSCSSKLLQCPFQIECHVNRQQNTIAWHYDGKQQAKSILPKAWKTNKKQLCAIVWVPYKGECVQMM